MEQPPGERRRADARPRPTEESRRAEAQAHLDGRRARLQAYADSLEAALAAGAAGEQRERLERDLAQARRDVRSAARPRVPQAKAEPLPAEASTAGAAHAEADQPAAARQAAG